MPIEILMPALSPTMEEGTLAKWLVKEGDTISSGDLIAEIETDKATMEFESIDEGIVGKILIAEGTEGVKVNSLIAILLEEGEDLSAISSDSSGDASDTPSAPAAVAAAPTPTSATPQTPTARKGDRVFASPLARRIAAQKGLDLKQIQGSGPHGRIVKADVESTTAQPAVEAEPVKTAPSAPVKSPDAASVSKLYADRDYEEVSLDGMRKTIAARLSEAKQTIPHFYLRRDIELDALLVLRKQLNDDLSGKGVKLSVNDFVIKACALALRDIPDCNAAWAGDRILKFSAADIAVAVAIPGGLITPVLRDAETKSLGALSAQMKDMATRARDRKLAPQEYQGGSFSISNLGMMGIDNFDAVINPPHGAILAVGAGVRKPVVKDEELAIATVMSVTLSVDHRVIDGALGAELLTSFKGYIEHPMTMLV